MEIWKKKKEDDRIIEKSEMKMEGRKGVGKGRKVGNGNKGERIWKWKRRRQ